MAAPRRFVLVVLAVAATLPALAFACNGSSGVLSGTPGQPGIDGGGAEDTGAVQDSTTAVDVPISLIVDSAPPDTFVPLNPYDDDAADIPEGGLRPTPGILTCAPQPTCNQFAGSQCCVGEEGGVCLVGAVTCPATTVTVTCNESADCQVGKVCCGTVMQLDAGFTGMGAECATSCPAPPLMQLCRTNSECPDAGPCVVQDCSDGNRYELCGLYSPPSDSGIAFTCTPH